jgi:hypothetical protein
MARPPVPTDAMRNVDATIRDTSSDDQNAMMDEMQPQKSGMYKLDPKTRIPVAKVEGSVWEGRKTGGKKRMKWLVAAWEESELYYSAGQMDHRRETGGVRPGNDVASKNRTKKLSSTNNQVYATINAEIPNVYAKNPEIEVTMNDPRLEPVGAVLKRFGNNIIIRKDTPGINLKPKARKCAMRASVMNEAWILAGYTMREDSAESVMEDIRKIGEELQKAKNESDILRLEGELMALEETCDMLNPAGPFTKLLRADQVIVDDASVEDDHQDANWMMAEVHFNTNYLNARYRPKNSKGEYVSAYKATHIVDARTDSNQQGVSDVQRQIDNFHIFDQGAENASSHTAYGYSEKGAFERAKFTRCWYCFDKVKRRFYLYADNDWTWPVWVFDDPYHLPTFFPLFKLQYHTDPKLTRTKGEVAHYLDQQDALNVMADEMNRARTALRDRVIADADLDQKKLEELLLSTDRMVVSMRVPEGKKLAEMIMGPPLTSMQYQHLWDPAPIMAQISQISGLGDAMRGEQFKTNTTNKAIEFYSSNSNVRLDEKRDAMEDFIGEVVWAVIFMCLQFMPHDRIAQIAGIDPANNPLSQFANMDAQTIRETFTCKCVGGSTQKPTSAAKKAEALQVGQIIGQFGSLPAAGIIAIKNLQRAFDGMTVTREDWEMLISTMMQGLQQGNNAPQGAEGAPAEGEEDAEGEGGPSEEEMVAEIIARGKAQGKTVTPMQAKTALARRANGAGVGQQQ